MMMCATYCMLDINISILSCIIIAYIVGAVENLHKIVVNLINEYKSKCSQVPASMQAIWDYEHIIIVDELDDIKARLNRY